MILQIYVLVLIATTMLHLVYGFIGKFGKQINKIMDENLDYESVKEIFDNVDSNWTGDNCFKGLLIIAKYFDVEKTDIVCWAGHDEICSVDIEESIQAGMTREDFIKLAELNWFVNEDSENLGTFV